MYYKEELLKIRKSKLGILMIIGILPLELGFCIMNILRLDKTESFLIFFAKTFNRFNVLIPVFYMCSIVLIALLFAKEFQGRTFTYVFLRPIKYHKLFLSKIIVTILYTYMVTLLYFIFTLLVGISFFSITPLPFDNSLRISIYRYLINLIATFIGVMMSAGICCLVSILVRNFVVSIVISIITFMIGSWPIPWGKGYISLTTYLFPGYCMDSSFEIFLSTQIHYFLMNFIVIFILFFASYKLSLRMRKGLGKI